MKRKRRRQQRHNAFLASSPHWRYILIVKLPLVQRVVEESPSSQGAKNAVKLSAMIKLDEEHERSEVVGDTSSA